MDDLISRQAAIDAYILHTMDYLAGDKPRRAFTEVLKELPTAQPERKGKWNCSDDIFEYAICSCCKWDSGEAWEYAKKYFRYCPNCGANMRGNEDETD